MKIKREASKGDAVVVSAASVEKVAVKQPA